MLNPKKLEMLNGQHKVKELKDLGFKFVIMPGYNRPVDSKHVRVLMASVRETGAFMDSIKYITAEEWFKFYPDRKIVLDSGKVLTKDSEGLDEILIILDGQHRYEADNEMGIEEGYQSTLVAELVSLPDRLTPDQWMTTVNSTSRNWNEKDRASYINALNPGERTNVSIAEQWQKDHGIGVRYAYSLLNFTDNYRKSSHIEYMRNPKNGLPHVLKGTPENQKRGIETLHAIEVGFRNYPRVIRNMAIVDFIIEVYAEASDKDKAETVENLKTFLMSLPKDIAESINFLRDKSSRKLHLNGEWVRFKKMMLKSEKKQELILKAQVAEEEWQKMMTAKKN